jgi:hypothetical protein
MSTQTYNKRGLFNCIHKYTYIYIAAFIGKDPKHINVQKPERIFFSFFFQKLLPPEQIGLAPSEAFSNEEPKSLLL